MNKFSIYQYLLILSVLVIGFLYALPNIYPTQPSIQVAYTDSGLSADQALLDDLENILEDSKTVYDEIFLRDNKIVIKFKDVETQLSSKTILQNALLDRVIIALFLEPSTPQWLKDIGANPVKLGLDLSGGVHFLLEVDIDTAQEGRLELLLENYRNVFKDERIKFDKSSIKDLKLYFEFSDTSIASLSSRRPLKKISCDIARLLFIFDPIILLTSNLDRLILLILHLFSTHCSKTLSFISYISIIHSDVLKNL